MPSAGSHVFECMVHILRVTNNPSARASAGVKLTWYHPRRRYFWCLVDAACRSAEWFRQKGFGCLRGSFWFGIDFCDLAAEGTLQYSSLLLLRAMICVFWRFGEGSARTTTKLFQPKQVLETFSFARRHIYTHSSSSYYTPSGESPHIPRT